MSIALVAKYSRNKLTQRFIGDYKFDMGVAIYDFITSKY